MPVRARLHVTTEHGRATRQQRPHRSPHPGLPKPSHRPIAVESHRIGTDAPEAPQTGQEVPFDQATLDRLYRSHADYVAKVTRSAYALAAQRFITPYDAAAIILEAARADIP